VSYCECDYDDDRPEFFSEMVVRARKQHRCTECFGPIFSGETYKRRSGKWDGEFRDYPECYLCMELREWATVSMPCFCANTFETLHEKAREMVDDIKRDVPGITFEWGRRMIKIKRRKQQMEIT
jgi:hypothetical protein